MNAEAQRREEKGLKTKNENFATLRLGVKDFFVVRRGASAFMFFFVLFY
ncbi:MAG: hypothetical protein AB1456_09220 [Thermodesulfobacteriota bacterium]|jgi:hypothetical protein